MSNSKSFLKYNFLYSLNSPVFYITGILFTVFVSINFYIRQQFFTGSGTTDLVLYFSAIPYICIIVIPSLCFKHTFTIYEDFIPLRNITKVFLTFIVRLFLFTILEIFLIPGVLLINLYGSIDPGQFFVSLICLLFYGAAVISVCGFLEVLIKNKVASLVVQAVVLGIFNSAHLFTVYVPLPQFLTELFKELSFAWHFDAAGKGILDTRDILWLTGSTTLFIFLSDFILELQKGKKYSTKQSINFAATLLLSILIMLNGNRWYKRLDFSANKTYTPSEYTKQLLSLCDDELKITYYRSSSISKLYPQIRDVTDFLTEYANLNKKVTLLIKDPDKDSKTRTLLENYGIQTQQLRSITNTSTEYTNVYSAIIIEHNGNAESIPFTMSANTLEYDMDGRVKHLLTGKSRVVNIVLGNDMSLDEDYSYLIPWLNSQGFICNPVYITDPAFVSVLSACSGPLLVIGDSEINIENAIAIEDYILQNKGKGLFMVSPYSVNISDDWYITQNKRTNVVEMLENWGVEFTSKIAADISCARIQMYSDDDSHTQVINYPLWPGILPQTNAPLGVTFFWSTPLYLSQPAEPYLITSSSSYFYDIDTSSPDKLLETNPFVVQTMDTSNKEKYPLILGALIKGSLNGLYNMESSNDTTVIVLPDQYFVNSLMTGYIGGDYGDYRNFEFLTTTLLKLNDENDLAQLQSRSTRDNSLYKITDTTEFLKYRFWTYVILFILIPLIFIISGAIFNVRKTK